MKFFTDRIRIVLFALGIIVLGMINPKKALQSVAQALDI